MATAATLRPATIPLREATRLPAVLRRRTPLPRLIPLEEVALTAVAAARMAAVVDPMVEAIAECGCPYLFKASQLLFKEGPFRETGRAFRIFCNCAHLFFSRRRYVLLQLPEPTRVTPNSVRKSGK